jgi:hypothetical protein
LLMVPERSQDLAGPAPSGSTASMPAAIARVGIVYCVQLSRYVHQEGLAIVDRTPRTAQYSDQPAGQVGSPGSPIEPVRGPAKV